MICWLCMGAVCVKAEKAVCKVPDEEACPKRMKMQMQRRIYDDGTNKRPEWFQVMCRRSRGLYVTAAG